MLPKQKYGFAIAASAVILILTVVQIITYFSEQNGQLFLNLAPGESKGLYMLVPLSEQSLRLGEKVLLNESMRFVSASERVLKEVPLLKTVAGLPGDRYMVSNTSIYVNGRYLGAVYEADYEGKALPQKRGAFVVKEDSILPVATKTDKAIDGRYIGDIPITAVWGKAIPILTF